MLEQLKLKPNKAFDENSSLSYGVSPAGTLKMRDMKMQDWKMRHKAAGFCRGWKMRDWKMWHKNTGLENAGKENAAQSR